MTRQGTLYPTAAMVQETEALTERVGQMRNQTRDQYDRAVQPSQSTGRHWDWLLLVAIIAVAGVSLYTMIQIGTFSFPLAQDDRLSWHLVRAAGLVSYSLLAVSTGWGVFLSTRLTIDWTPSPVTLLLHATTSWLAVGLMFVHAGLLLADSYYSYKITDLIIPFTGPYRPIEVGLGIISAWLTLGITLSFSVRKWMGMRAWRLLHYTSYFVFGLVTVHALLSGTDATSLGMRLMLLSFSVVVFGLMIYRIVLAQRTRQNKLAAAR